MHTVCVSRASLVRAWTPRRGPGRLLDTQRGARAREERAAAGQRGRGRVVAGRVRVHERRRCGQRIHPDGPAQPEQHGRAKPSTLSPSCLEPPRPRFNVGDGALTIFRDMTEKV